MFYVSARGLTTSPIPYGDRVFQLDFDFLDHVLRASTRRRPASPRPRYVPYKPFGATT
ncbi:MAG: DUF5996 family protein [Methyloceanibacter sp.]